MQDNQLISTQTQEENSLLAQNLAAEIKLNDPALSTTYGTDAMRNISRFADTLLEQVRAKDAGPIGESLGALLGQVQEFDPRSIADAKPHPLAGIPIIGRLFDDRQRSITNFNTLAGQVDAIALKLEDAMTSLLRDIEVLEQLYDLNRDFHNDLALYIEAGQLRLQQA
ncbi:MAG: toxic anion resistance protein, partial [Desulfovibrionaceae bacterium]|nr:toxic anion resistance protein [Desulfovibrionaceae bacterium]